ncbi:hypothetical protein [Nocardia sp. NPDC003979]
MGRQRLYEHHGDLVAEFRAAAGSGPVTPNIAALQRQLDNAQLRIRELEAQLGETAARNKSLRAVIAELTQETYTDNIIQLSSRHGS